jgi:hypothetical protein
MIPEQLSAGALEIRGPARALIDEPLAIRARGAGPGEKLLWRARLRDDDVRVWRAQSAQAATVGERWRPAKASTGAHAALGSLRPVPLEVRVEAPDGRAAARTFTRLLVAEGVRIRRWREPGLAATLYLPAGDEPCATVMIEGAGALSAPLLASRGALVLALTEGDVDAARERLAAVPAAGGEVELFADPVLPPGIPARDDDHAGRARRWDALLARLGARPRGPAGDG